MLFRTENSANSWKVANFLNFEAKGLSLHDRLHLLQYAISRAKTRAKPPFQKQELDYVERDCLKALIQLEQGEIEESDPFLHQRLARMARIVSYYEGRAERFNRRYWWLLFLIGAGLVILLASQTGTAL